MSGRPKLAEEAIINEEAERLLIAYQASSVTVTALAKLNGMTYTTCYRRLARARRNRAGHGKLW